MKLKRNFIPIDERKYCNLHALHLLSKSEQIASLQQVILRRAPGISSKQLELICNSINTNRRYFIKSTTDKDKFMNYITREMIISDEKRMFSEVLPIYGQFQAPYFEKIGSDRRSVNGELDPSFSAAAIKIRAGIDNQRSSVTYSLILYMAKYDKTVHGL